MANGKKVRENREQSPRKAAGGEEAELDDGGNDAVAERGDKEAVMAYVAELRATAARALKMSGGDVPAATAEYLKDLAARLEREASEIETGARPFSLQR